ncbi:unnamed protein product [Lampetra planeri]
MGGGGGRAGVRGPETKAEREGDETVLAVRLSGGRSSRISGDCCFKLLLSQQPLVSTRRNNSGLQSLSPAQQQQHHQRAIATAATAATAAAAV